MPDLIYTIKSQAELAGAEAAAAALEKQIGAAKAAGKDFAALDTQLQRARDTIATYQKSAEKGAEATTAAGEAAKKTSAPIAGLARVFGELNQLVPGLGALMQAAFSPIGAAVSLAVTAITLFRTRMAELNEEFRRLSEEYAQPLNNRLQAQREHVVANATAMADLRNRLAEAARGEQNLKDQTDAAIAAFTRQVSNSKSLSEALQRNEMAALETLHSNKLISEQQFEQMKLAFQISARRKSREFEEKDELTKIMMRRRILEQAKDAQPELEADAKAKLSAKLKAEENLAAAATPAQVEARLQAAKTEMARVNALLPGSVVNQYGELGPYRSRDDILAWMNQRVSQGLPVNVSMPKYYKWSRATQDLSLAQREFNQNPALRKRFQEEVSAASVASDLASNRAISAQSFITTESREVPRAEAAARSTREANAQIERMNLQTDVMTRWGEQGGPQWQSALPAIRGILQANRQGNQETAGLFRDILSSVQANNQLIIQFRNLLRQNRGWNTLNRGMQ